MAKRLKLWKLNSKVLIDDFENGGQDSHPDQSHVA